MQALFRDFRYGIRSLVKSPGLTLIATFALTLGIGLTTTAFSIVYGALMKGLPVPDGDRIVQVYRNNPTVGARHMSVPIADYEDYRTGQHTLSSIGAYYSGTVNVSGTGDAERFTGAWVTASTFDVARGRTVLGRTFQAGEDVPGGPRLAIIGYGMWQRRFGGDPSIVGKSIRANGVPFEIIGVMAEGYRFPDDASIWLPLQMERTPEHRDQGQQVNVVGMLKPGVSVDEAAVDFDAIAKRLQTEYKATNENIGAVAEGFVDADMGPEPRQLLQTMLGAVFFVLLIACANVANLLLDRAAHRTKEVGIRTALGASRMAVVRQFLSEAFLLSIVGAVLGTVLAGIGIGIFNRAIVDSQPPFYIDIKLHPPVLLFTVGISLLATMFAGLLPAIQSSRADINEVLKDETRGSSSLHIGKMSRVLVVLEIALSCGLLVASGLMIKSVTKLRNIDPGFRTSNIFTARIGFPATYTDSAVQKQFYIQLQERLATLPGATDAAIASGLPAVNQNGGNFTVDGVSYAADKDVPRSTWLAVSPGFFQTFEIQGLQGRLLDDRDRADAAPVAVVNKAFADKFFAGGDPIGHRIRQGGRTSTEAWMTIVGVVPTLFTGQPDEPRAPAYYAPLSQHHTNFVSLSVQTTSAPMSLTADVRKAVAALNPDIPLYWVYSMEEAIARPTWYIRVFGTMFMIFGLIALFLASVGLYAVMSFSVSRRVREVGIRMALGAQGRDVVRMIFRQGAWQLAIGMVLGLALAAAIAQTMQVILFEVQPRDPATFIGVVVVLTVTGLLACLVPARRATRIDPLTALRVD